MEEKKSGKLGREGFKVRNESWLIEVRQVSRGILSPANQSFLCRRGRIRFRDAVWLLAWLLVSGSWGREVHE
jgi:hypothetical protein